MFLGVRRADETDGNADDAGRPHPLFLDEAEYLIECRWCIADRHDAAVKRRAEPTHRRHRARDAGGLGKGGDIGIRDEAMHLTAEGGELPLVDARAHHLDIRIDGGPGPQGLLRCCHRLRMQVDEWSVLHISRRVDDARIDFRLDLAQMIRRQMWSDELHAAIFDFPRFLDKIHQTASCCARNDKTSSNVCARCGYESCGRSMRTTGKPSAFAAASFVSVPPTCPLFFVTRTSAS